MYCRLILIEKININEQMTMLGLDKSTYIDLEKNTFWKKMSTLKKITKYFKS